VTGFVYFIGGQLSERDARVKIGYTDSKPSVRLKALQTGSPIKLRVLAYLRGDMRLEAKLHETFMPLHLHGEWFSLDQKLHDLVWYLSYQNPNMDNVNALFKWAVDDVILFSEIPEDHANPEAYLASANMQIWGGASL
jgi:Meiotically up-regulated gene 113